MSDVFDAALFPDMLDEAERARLQRLVEADESARRQYEAVRALQMRVGADLDAAVPDRTLLVCEGLRAAGRAHVLTDAERARLADAAPALASASTQHPALADVSRQIARDAEAFDACWLARSVRARRPLMRPPSRRAGVRRTAWRVAGALTVFAFALSVFLLVQRDAAYTTVEVARGEVRNVTLADGSTVKLMGGSRLTYSDPARNAVFNRQVRLRGDAYFDVAHAAQRFVVRTADADVTVLGTRFAVRAGASATEVTLVDGRLLLAPSGAPTRGVTLAPGQMSRLTRGAQAPTAPEAIEPGAALAWTGLFFFRDTPLSEAATHLAAAFGVRVEVASPLQHEAITGTFDRAQGAEEILQTLATALDARVVRTETGWRVE